MQTIPISIILYSLRAKKVNQLKLFLYLKATTSGKIKLTDEAQEKICAALGWKDHRTYKTHIQWLLHHHWTTINTKTQELRLVSYQQLHKTIKGKIYTGSKMSPEDFKTFRPFIYASIICWAIFAKRKYKIMSERKKGHSIKSITYSLQNEMPNRYLAKIIGSDQSTIARYKKEAQEEKYINIQKQTQDLHLGLEHIPMIQKYATEEIRNSIFIKNGSIHIRKSDLISSRIQLTYMRHLRKPKPTKPPA